MTVRLSTQVMAHPARARYVAELVERLDRDDVGITWDERNDRWDTGRRSMLAYDPAATHHLVVQDDAVVPRRLIAGVERAIAAVPDSAALCLYAGNTARFWNAIVRERHDPLPANTSWLVMNQLHWGVGVVMPTALITAMVSWCDQLTAVGNYDRRISRWCETRGVQVFYPWPSLVDHRQSPSLVAGRGARGRHARRFIGVAADATTQPLHGPTIDLSRARAQRMLDRGRIVASGGRRNMRAAAARRANS